MKYLLYGHGGSYNHGAEAIVRTTVEMLRKNECEIILSTHFIEQDREFGINKIVDKLIQADLSLIPAEKSAKTFAEKLDVDRMIYRDALSIIDNDTVCIGIGGDNYCYNNWHRQVIFHVVAKENGAKSILWGCSVEPQMIDEEMRKYLQQHDHIYARETHSFRALQKNGIKKLTLVSDPAFNLRMEEVDLPENFSENNTVAINVSPLVLRKNKNLMDDFVKAVREIIKYADRILLLPHVIMPTDNDIDALNQLEELLTKEERKKICHVSQKLNAAQLKYLISKCKMLICCRTHASIAGYSLKIPTLVVGYSVKSRGIAEDIGMSKWTIQAGENNRLFQIILDLLNTIY